MKAKQQMHDLGQSLWFDSITCGLLTSGTLGRFISEPSVTGPTLNPASLDQVIGNARNYDAATVQHEAVQSFAKSRNDLMDRVVPRSTALTQSQPRGATS
ncbi:MAG: hypothetical protein WBX11_06575 [Thiobacillaceae bacterium]